MRRRVDVGDGLDATIDGDLDRLRRKSLGDSGAGEDGETFESFMSATSNNLFQSSAFTGIRIGVAGRVGRSLGIVTEYGLSFASDCDPRVSLSSWSYTARTCVGNRAFGSSKAPRTTGTSKRRGGGTPSSSETRLTL